MKERWRHFTQKETEGLKYEVVDKLDAARHAAGTQFVLTSTVRTADKNSSVGGVANSAHLKGLAVDISATTSHQRYKILPALIDAGFTRILIYKKHIHADLDKTKPQHIIAFGNEPDAQENV